MFKTLKIIGFLVFVLCNSVFYAQEDNPKEQSFEILEFHLNKAFEDSIDSSLNFNFKLQVSKPLQDPFKHPYTIHFSLFKNKQLVWENKEEKQFYAEKPDEFFDGLVVYQIPFEDIKIEQGEQNLLLKIKVSYKEHSFPMVFEKVITVNFPKLFDYNQQEFSLTDYHISLDSSSYKTPRILIRFHSKAKFVQNQIKGIKDNPFIGEYLFQIQLIDKKTNEQIGLRNSKTGLLSFNVNELENNHQLFIPFNELILQPTKHSVEIQLVVNTKDQSRELSKTQIEEIVFTQPIVHALHFNLSQALIKEKKYDPTNLLGRIFSSTKSNVGKGNPDVYWELRTGDFVKFTSQITDNSFTASAEECVIWVTNQDSIQLVFWDKDVFKDDWVETIQLLNPSIGILKKNTQSKFENLDKIDFSYIKK